MPATDNFKYFVNDPTGPLRNAVAITPDDDNDLPFVTRALWVGGAGTLAVVMESGATASFSGVQAGTQLDFRVKRVLATGTTATLMQALE